MNSLNLGQSAQIWLESNAAPIGWAWLVCTVLLWLRLMGGWWLAQRLRRREVSPANETLRMLCDDWAKRLGIQPRIQLLESAYISEPLTLGFWKPVVLFPVGMLLQLSPAQVEALLLHELAHIRRHDYFVNLFQLALEVCFFYHPLFWLLSREARSRREFCCDELVLRHTSDPILYAKTLTDLQLSILHPSTSFVMNATGKSRFTQRILNIVGITPKRSTRPNFFIALLVPLALGLSSWWPSMPEPAMNDALNWPTFPILDTTPTRTAALDTSIAQPKENRALAQKKDLKEVADTLGNQEYSVKFILDLSPMLDGKYSSGSIQSKIMQQSKGLYLVLKNLNLDTECTIVGFEATYLPKDEDPTARQNQGGLWNSGVSEWIKKAKAGDVFYFDDILVKCPGDVKPRNVGGMAFKIILE